MTHPTHGLDPNALEAELHKLRRTLQMQANIMRDPTRTGAWEGAERVANAFARAAEKVAEIEGTVTQKQVAQDFDNWWSLDGQYIDPDTDDVPWFDKRRGLAMAAFQAGGESHPDFKRMVERFLTWKLPEDFNPDGGVHFEPYGNLGTPHEYRRKPTGTNLFDAAQTEAMLRHVLSAETAPMTDDRLVQGLRTIVDALTYPVSKEIDPKGWSLHTPNEDRNAFAAETALAALSQNPGTSNTSGEAVAISVKTMKLSDGREDHYVSIRVGDREITPHKYSIKGRAEFDVAEWNWLLNGAEKPDVVDWLDRTRPLAALEPRASDREAVIEEIENAMLWFAGPLTDRKVLRFKAEQTAAAIRKLSEVSHEH